MIKPGEIQKIANENGVRDTQIEKDYILSWILCGISKNKILSENLIFKGGTVLKKAYFKNYRFSEDLDFTLSDNSISDEDIYNEFYQVMEFIGEEANIALEIRKGSKYGSGSFNFYIHYKGPLGGSKENKKIKIDITRGEKMECEIQSKIIFNRYSDLKDLLGNEIKCYDLKEILIEKLTAIMGRTQARDVYDLWYLLRVSGMDIIEVIYEYKNKAENKGHKPEELMDKITEKTATFKGQWENALSDQITNLPNFDSVMRVLNKHIKILDKNLY